MSQHAQRSLMGATVDQNPATNVQQAPSLHGYTEENTGTQNVDGTPAATSPTQAPTHDWEKRYKDLQSYHSRLILEKDNTIANLNTANPVFKVPKTAEEISAFSQANPEQYAFIQSIAHGIAQEQVASMSGELTTVKSELQKTAKEKALDDLQRMHPDFSAIDQSPEFHNWISTQPVDVQGWIFNNPDDAQKVSWALSLFKQQTGWGVKQETNPAPQVNTQAAEAVPVSGPSGSAGLTPRDHPQYVWNESEIAKMRPEEYAANEAAIDLAMQEGRIAHGR